VHRILLLVLAFGLVGPSYAQTEPQPADSRITNYQQHRQTHIAEMGAERQAFEKATRELRADIERTQIDIDREAAEIPRLQRKLAVLSLSTANTKAVYHGLVNVIFPPLLLAGATDALGVTDGGGVSGWAAFFFIVTLVNLFLVLVYRERALFEKHRSILIALFVFMLLIYAVPAMAQQEETRQQVSEKLELVSDILGKSNHQRYIAILESQQDQSVEVPSLQSGDALLFTLPTVSEGTAERLFTLAALYSHENMLGKAVEAISSISRPTVTFSSDSPDQIIINSVMYLLKQQQTQAATELLDGKLILFTNVSEILEFSKFLAEQGMSSSADAARERAITQARSASDLMQLVKFFDESAEHDKSSNALGRAADLAKSRNDLLSVLRLAVGLKREETVTVLLERRLPEVAPSFDDRIPILDVLLELGRKEEAIKLISNALAEITRTTPDRVPALTRIIEIALARGLPEQALSGTTKLASYLGVAAFEHPMRIPPDMQSAQGLDVPENVVTLLLYAGLVNEESGFKDSAEVNYSRAILNSLQQVANSYGHELPESLTDFQLLGRLWAEGKQGALLEDLDVVYLLLEQHQLGLLKAQHRSSMTELKLQHAELASKQSSGSQNTKASLVRQIKQQELERIKSGFMIVAALLFILLVICIAAWKAVLFARPKIGQKTFAGTAKFFEVIGWVQMLSIFNVIGGLFVVVISQLLLLFHRTADNTTATKA